MSHQIWQKKPSKATDTVIRPVKAVFRKPTHMKLTHLGASAEGWKGGILILDHYPQAGFHFETSGFQNTEFFRHSETSGFPLQNL